MQNQEIKMQKETGKGQFLCKNLSCGQRSKKTLQTSVNLLCSQFSSNFNYYVMLQASRPHNCTHVHVKTLVHIYVCSRHYVMCPIFRSFWTLLRMIVCPTRFLATARFGSRCKMLDKARCDIRSRCCLVWILLALLFEGKFTRKRNTCRLNTIADSETELNERINMVTPTTTGTPERWMQLL